MSVSLHIRPRTLVLDTNILVRSQKSYDTITFIRNGGPPSTTSLLDHCFVRYFSILYAMVDHLTDTLCHRSITWPRWRSLPTMATGRSEYQQLSLLSWRCKFMIIMMMMITVMDSHNHDQWKLINYHLLWSKSLLIDEFPYHWSNIIFQGLAKSGAGFQRAEDSSAEHIAQVQYLIGFYDWWWWLTLMMMTIIALVQYKTR